LDLDGVVDGTSGEDGRPGTEVDGGGLYCREKCGGELAGVQAVFVEGDEAMVTGVECGKKVGEVFGGKFAARVGNAEGDSLQGGVGLEGNAEAGEDAEAVEEVGVERDTQVGEGAELGRVVRIAGGEHSGGGGGGFGERDGLIQHADADAALMKFEGEGEADDPGSSNADITIRKARVAHGISLVRWPRGYSLGVEVCRRRIGRRSAT
jgi:hypothetical protein